MKIIGIDTSLLYDPQDIKEAREIKDLDELLIYAKKHATFAKLESNTITLLDYNSYTFLSVSLDEKYTESTLIRFS